MADEFELAITRAQHALDRVIAAWDAEHPDLPVYPATPPPPAWHPDPNQAPATTRQWAEVTRMRASALRQERLQVHQQAKQVQQAAQRLHAFLHRPPDPGEFIRVGPAILLPPATRPRWYERTATSPALARCRPRAAARQHES